MDGAGHIAFRAHAWLHTCTGMRFPLRCMITQHAVAGRNPASVQRTIELDDAIVSDKAGILEVDAS